MFRLLSLIHPQGATVYKDIQYTAQYSTFVRSFMEHAERQLIGFSNPLKPKENPSFSRRLDATFSTCRTLLVLCFNTILIIIIYCYLILY